MKKILTSLFFISAFAFASGYFGGNTGGGGGSPTIGGAVTGGTNNSILFVNPSGILNQNNSNFTWNNSTNFLHLVGSVGVNSTNGPTFDVFDPNTAGSGTNSSFNFHRSVSLGEQLGNPVSLTVTNDSTGNLTRLGTDGLSFGYNSSTIQSTAGPLTVEGYTGLALSSVSGYVQLANNPSATYLYTDSSGDILSGTNAVGTITSLTGDVTASGNGAVAATLSTVNSNTGSFGSSSSIPSFTVNGKGLITAASSNAITLATQAANTLLGNGTGSTASPTALSTSSVHTLLTYVSQTAVSNTASNTGSYTINNFGTVTNADIREHRIGDRLYVQGSFTSGTPSASTASITLPYTINSSQLTSYNPQLLGNLISGISGTLASTSTGPWAVFYDGSTTSGVFLTNSISSNALAKANASSLASSGNVLTFAFDVPISGWSNSN